MITSVPAKYTSPVLKKDQPDDSFKFQPLPRPSGNYPYHLSLQTIKPAISTNKMVFHMLGDTGSVRNLDFQCVVVGEMIGQYETAAIAEDKPQFLYHLGDIVYNFGEEQNYYDQFFSPYRYYPGLMFAIAGNHDSDVNPQSQVPYSSLDAFIKVFCDSTSHKIEFSGDTEKKSIGQPNVYWTLDTSLASIIGLYGNVPKYGVITMEQRSWFIEELKTANSKRPGKAIIICVHHAPYSADINHGSSKIMIEFLESAFAETGIKPDIVFSGHVHNYQRFTRRYSDGSTVPYIVAGAGGFDELHAVASLDDQGFTGESVLFKNVQLEKYCDDRHGFLRIVLEKNSTDLMLTGEYFSIPHDTETDANAASAPTDNFTVRIA